MSQTLAAASKGKAAWVIHNRTDPASMAEGFAARKDNSPRALTRNRTAKTARQAVTGDILRHLSARQPFDTPLGAVR
jgi:hypothetical protein